MSDDAKNESTDDSEAGECPDPKEDVEIIVPDLGGVIVEGAEPNRRKRLKESGDDN